MVEKINETKALYSAMSITTTKTPVLLMMPVPLTGIWAPGPTMKVAVEVAVDLINQQQKLLEGKEIVIKFFDDQCDSEISMRTLLTERTNNDQWVGVGGM